MLLIGLTGNYNFFNFLTMVLCVSCWDDRHCNYICNLIRYYVYPLIPFCWYFYDQSKYNQLFKNNENIESSIINDNELLQKHPMLYDWSDYNLKKQKELSSSSSSSSSSSLNQNKDTRTIHGRFPQIYVSNLPWYAIEGLLWVVIMGYTVIYFGLNIEWEEHFKINSKIMFNHKQFQLFVR